MIDENETRYRTITATNHLCNAPFMGDRVTPCRFGASQFEAEALVDDSHVIVNTISVTKRLNDGF